MILHARHDHILQTSLFNQFVVHHFSLFPYDEHTSGTGHPPLSQFAAITSSFLAIVVYGLAPD
jgi:hypothetical protein